MEAVTARSAGVSLENLSLSYGRQQVLKGIDLKIEPGEFFAFLGPSGSGKSTLLRAIAGFGPSPTGRILIGKEDVSRLPPWKRNVGMVFQNYALWPHMTVRRNVSFGLEERRRPKREIRDKVDAVLELVGLLDLAERWPSQLSGGQQQRVALARTIVVEPRVLLLDEPLSNLDANLRIQMRQEIRDLQQKLKLTTVFVTHDQEEANTTADRMAVLDEGVIQQIGTPMELYDQPANQFVANFLGTANLLEGTVTKEKGKSIFTAGDTIRIPFKTAIKGACTILIRPQDVKIADTKTKSSSGHLRMKGKILHTEFLGGIIRYSVDVGGQRLLVDSGHQRGASARAPGTAVSLLLDKDKVLVLSQ